MPKETARFSKQRQAFRDALQREIAALPAEDDKRGLRRLSRAQIEKGAEGDVHAIREVADRLDGKVAQAIAGDDELPPVDIITGVARAGDAQD